MIRGKTRFQAAERWMHIRDEKFCFSFAFAWGDFSSGLYNFREASGQAAVPWAFRWPLTCSNTSFRKAALHCRSRQWLNSVGPSRQASPSTLLSAAPSRPGAEVRPNLARAAPWRMRAARRPGRSQAAPGARCRRRGTVSSW